MRRPVIYFGDILAWADAYHECWRRWPARNSGPVAGQIDLTWCGVDQALRKGNRGLPSGSSLPQLLAEHRGVRNRGRLPRLSAEQILAWADAHRQRTGEWPNRESGAVAGARWERWDWIDRVLAKGDRGLSGGSSLARLLARRRGVRNPADLPDLTLGQILAWADAHRERSGEWPTRDSGPVLDAEGETWAGIAEALFRGRRGLRRDTLTQLLARRRGRRDPKSPPRLRACDILAWADRHRERTGQWPTHTSGAVADAPGETWGGIHCALRRGDRGLRGGSSLYRLLRHHRGVDRQARRACRMSDASRRS